MRSPLIALAPADAPSWLADAITAGGGTLVEPARADGLVWFGPFAPEALRPVLAASPARWVQLPWAGVEPYLSMLTPDRQWTCGKGVYAEATAEHALALTLALFRELPRRVKAGRWEPRSGRSLFDARVTIVGGGGIGEVLLRLLAPFRCEVTVVRRRPAPMPGAAAVVGTDGLHAALATADVVILSLPLTPETTGVIGRDELLLMRDEAILVNVARGAHVVTDDLVAVLRDGGIAGAALDVTDPEPLPDGHPLWTEPRCLITPHTANTPEMVMPSIVERIRENVRRFGAGEPLIGTVDLELGY
ncbi:MAG TPA: D-isomer specific 2-hydroxyacid dehydrogenase family protein [Acidimicrobiales bacterium]|nr:D-isomer specific 2-hydroxyacid dehydrogenase family protein [Acidimicrobiales bacterium]